MSWPRSFTFLLFLITASALADNEVNIRARSPLLENRQECQTAGWIPACPGLFACVPPGAICCSDGYTYAMPPDTCPDGTQAVTTAGVEGPSSAALTTAAPTFTPAPIVYTYYTTEFTWYYWYYYFTWVEIYQSTTLTSSQVTTVTTVSVSATDSVGASLAFQSLSATAILPTPTQTATVLSGTTPTPTPTPTPASPSTSTPVAIPTTSFESQSAVASSKAGGEGTSTVTSHSFVVGGSTTTQAATPTQVVAAGAGRVGSGLTASWSGLGIMGLMMMAPGVLMVWL